MKKFKMLYELYIRRNLAVKVSSYGEVLGSTNLWDPHQILINIF
jgi:hypothetical protein